MSSWEVYNCLLHNIFYILFVLCTAVFFCVKVTTHYNIRSCFSKMKFNAEVTENTDDVTPKGNGGKSRKISKPRPIARPYKKLEQHTLETRVDTMKKQMSIFSSKMILLQARLINYERESALRGEDTAKDT